MPGRLLHFCRSSRYVSSIGGKMRHIRALQSILESRLGYTGYRTQTAELIFNSRYFCSKRLPVLTMYTKDNCSLCDDARLILEKYKHRYNFEEVYITDKGNEEWFKKYRYEIPVFHLNGSFLMKHRVNEKILEETLAKNEEN